MSLLTIRIFLLAIRHYRIATVNQFQFPASLENRFKWLAANDVHVQQQLLNYFQELEKSQAVELFKVELPVIFKHRSGSSEHIQSLRKIIQINNYKFEFEFLPSGDTVLLEEPKRPASIASTSSKSHKAASKKSNNYNWIFWVIGAVALLIMLAG